MTLARIFPVVLFCSVLLGSVSLIAQDQSGQQGSTPQQTPATSFGSPNASGNASGAGPTQAQPSSSPTSKKPAPGQVKPKPHKKSIAPLNCNPPAAKPGSSSGKTTQANSSEASGNAKQASNAAAGNTKKPQTLTNCPPSKKIVRNGGATEPSIELLGGTGGIEASNERATTDQLLAATQGNLSRVHGKALTANQQDMVTQIHEFMSQSREAVVEGDMDRGRMLALKARLLSDELVKQP